MINISNEMKCEMKELWRLSWPVAFSYATNFIVFMFTLILVGKQLGTVAFDGVALGTLTCNLTGFFFAFFFI